MTNPRKPAQVEDEIIAESLKRQMADIDPGPRSPVDAFGIRADGNRAALLRAIFSGAVANVSGTEAGGIRVHRLLLLPLRRGNACPQPVVELDAAGIPIVTEGLRALLDECHQKHEAALGKKRESIARARAKHNRGGSNA